MRRFNIAASLALLALAAFILFEVSKLPFGSFRVPQTAFFPTILSLLLLIFSLILLVQALRAKETLRGPEPIATDGWVRIGATLATMLAFALVLETLGFLLSTFVLMVLLLRAIEAQPWRVVVGVALSTALISYFLFARLLGIPLPGGILGI